MRFEYKDGEIQYTIRFTDTKCFIKVTNDEGGWSIDFDLKIISYYISILKDYPDYVMSLLVNMDRKIKLNSILL